MSSPVDSLAFWGKARPQDGAPHAWHPVAYHLLDVAAAADAILQARPLTLARGARLLGLEPAETRRLLVALAGLHDLGKFTSAFQAKAAPAGWTWPSAFGGCAPARVRGTHHTDDGYALWHHALAARVAGRLWREGEGALGVLAPAIFGHHGQPTNTDALRRRPLEGVFEAAAAGVACACADAVTALLCPAPLDAAPPDRRRARLASWWIAGLMTVADWVGSNQQWFPYAAPDPDDADLARYWSIATAAAARAVREAGLAGPHAAPATSFSRLTGIATPSPAQAWAEAVPLPDGPVLVVVEDATGAGKTEAAQMLVHRLMADGRASGAYWAMPTQATANAMYARQAAAIAALFAPGAGRPMLALAHGQAGLHARFRTTVLGSAAEGPEARADGHMDDPELAAGAACAAFLADDRRAALLADVGAGSVDQALLGALPSRFNAVRLFALADKVLVIDEAHAYDAYMRVEAQQLLRFHAALGGSAVVLSATLTRRQRGQLVTAWREGLDGGRRMVEAEPGTTLVRAEAYPLATVVSAGPEPVRETALDVAERSRRAVPVRFVHAADDAIAHVVTSSHRGAAVAWVRNTVDDCLAAARTLRAQEIDVLVFHARFAQADRRRREDEVLALFGKPDAAYPGREIARRGRVVVATQVIEQSLDLDFDVLVSDLAPVDLLIQRAGRLWRHQARDGARPAGVARELVVLAPAADPDPPTQWLRELLPGTCHVYRNVGVLWRTVMALHRAGAIVTPGGLRSLTEGVYASDVTPPSLLPAADRAHGEEQGNAAAANHATLNVGDGYDGSAKGWVDDVRARTRLGDEDAIVRLARVRADGALEPWARDDVPAWQAWALSEVRLSPRRVPPGSQAEPAYRTAIDALRAGWKRHERETLVLPLARLASGGWQGTLVRPDGRPVPLGYTSSAGLEYLSQRPDPEAGVR